MLALLGVEHQTKLFFSQNLCRPTRSHKSIVGSERRSTFTKYENKSDKLQLPPTYLAIFHVIFKVLQPEFGSVPQRGVVPHPGRPDPLDVRLKLWGAASGRILLDSQTRTLDLGTNSQRDMLLTSRSTPFMTSEFVS